MERVPVTSSSLRSIGYDSDSKLLEVEFRSFAVYLYRSVPDWAVERLMAARSLGRHFEAHIRGRYPFERLE